MDYIKKSVVVGEESGPVRQRKQREPRALDQGPEEPQRGVGYAGTSTSAEIADMAETASSPTSAVAVEAVTLSFAVPRMVVWGSRFGQLN